MIMAGFKMYMPLRNEYMMTTLHPPIIPLFFGTSALLRGEGQDAPWSKCWRAAISKLHTDPHPPPLVIR